PEALPAVDAQPAGAAFRRAIDSGRDVDYEGTEGGRYLRVRVHRTPWGVLAIGADMTARHRIEQVTAQANTQLMRTAAAIPVPIIVADGAGLIARANPAAHVAFGGGPLAGRS